MNRPGQHLLVVDPEVPADSNGRAFCRCGAREDNVAHKLPEVPAQAEHHHRYEPSEED